MARNPRTARHRPGDGRRRPWAEGHAALVEDRADALATGRAAEIVGELQAAGGKRTAAREALGPADARPYRAGRQGEAPAPINSAPGRCSPTSSASTGGRIFDGFEAAIVAQDVTLEIPATQQLAR